VTIILNDNSLNKKIGKKMNQKQINKWYIVFTFFILLMLIFPVFSLGNYATPLILGMPMSMAWVLFWILVEFIGLVIFIRLDKEED
tara:strand:- start:7355 stop:7612 length:258 start_codon:yes stop_codon:yes gene_type:complete